MLVVLAGRRAAEHGRFVVACDTGAELVKRTGNACAYQRVLDIAIHGRPFLAQWLGLNRRRTVRPVAAPNG